MHELYVDQCGYCGGWMIFISELNFSICDKCGYKIIHE